MKSKEEWFKLLPPKIKAKARKNTKVMGGDALKYMANSLSTALMNSFVWAETPEGHRFWLKLYDQIRHNEQNEES